MANRMRTRAYLVAGVLVAGLTAALVFKANSNAAPDYAPAVTQSIRGDPSGQQTGRHLALLIGIGDYQRFKAFGYAPRVDLKGPPHDLERMRLTLRRFGFEGDNVRILKDEECFEGRYRGRFPLVGRPGEGYERRSRDLLLRSRFTGGR